MLLKSYGSIVHLPEQQFKFFMLHKVIQIRSIYFICSKERVRVCVCAMNFTHIYTYYIYNNLYMIQPTDYNLDMFKREAFLKKNISQWEQELWGNIRNWEWEYKKILNESVTNIIINRFHKIQKKPVKGTCEWHLWKAVILRTGIYVIFHVIAKCGHIAHQNSFWA